MKEFTFDDAKKIAEDMAFQELHDISEAVSLIDEYFIEADNCWMFFRNRDIAVPNERWFGTGAYIVSNTGEARYIADFYDDSNKAKDYLYLMSEYFKRARVQ